jgi:hypothetical protein
LDEVDMRIRSLVIKSLAIGTALLAPMPAGAQTWQNYDYPDVGFAVHFPAAPAVTKGVYRTAAGLSAPSAIYSVRQDNVVYTVTVADFSQTAVEKDPAIADAVKAFGDTGEIKVDVDARINTQFGHELTVANKDGSRSTVAIFFFNHRLYQLEGRAAPPDPTARSSSLIRFQQSLQFFGR